MKNFVYLCLLLANVGCLNKSTSSEADTEAIGFNDLDEIRFSFGKTETSHLNSPENDTIDSVKGPMSSDDVEAAFMQSLAPLFGDMVAKDLISIREPSDIIPSIAGMMSGALRETVKKANENLSGPRYVMNYGLLPYRRPAEVFSDSGFSYTGGRINDIGLNFREGFLKNVNQSMTELQKKGFAQKDSLSHYLLGVLFKVVLVKNESYAELQLALGLNPKKVKFFFEIPEAEIHQLVIPSATKPENSTTMVIKLKIDLATDKPTKAQVKFGTFHEIAETSVTDFSFEINTPSTGTLWTGFDCEGSHKAQPYLVVVPKLTKVANPRLGAVDTAISADMRFRELEINLNSAQLSDLKLGLSGGPNAGFFRFTLGCFTQRSVDSQVLKGVNDSITAQLNKGQEILNALLNGK